MIKCRSCGGLLSTILKQKNMPNRAQHLPIKKELKSDPPVDLDICQCNKCGLVQLRNSPVSYYRDVVRATGLSQEMTEFRIGQLKAFVKQFKLEDQKALEIGCGKGEFLSLLNQVGLIASGVEHDPGSVNYCEKNGLNVYQSFLGDKDHNLINQSKAFFMFCYLEHLPYPGRMLNILYNNLRNDAVGIIEVPNFDMILEKRLFTEFCIDHLLYFTRKTLTTMLENSGFEVISCEPIWHDYILSAVVRKRSLLDLSIFDTKINTLKQQFVKEIPSNAQIAVWGAGHQSFATICLADLKPKYIVDSAPFKQGKYSPASHIPIVSPSTLISDPVDHIIVIAGSYNNEVIKIIRHEMKLGIKIWIINNSTLEEQGC